MVEESIIFDCLYSDLMVRCLLEGPFSATSSTKCLFIRTVVRISEEFEKDVSLGLLDLQEKAMREINGYDQILNQHTDAELNAVSRHLSIWQWMKFINRFLFFYSDTFRNSTPVEQLKLDGFISQDFFVFRASLLIHHSNEYIHVHGKWWQNKPNNPLSKYRAGWFDASLLVHWPVPMMRLGQTKRNLLRSIERRIHLDCLCWSSKSFSSINYLDKWRRNWFIMKRIVTII